MRSIIGAIILIVGLAISPFARGQQQAPLPYRSAEAQQLCPPIPTWYHIPTIPKTESSQFGNYVGVWCGRFGGDRLLIGLMPDGAAYYILEPLGIWHQRDIDLQAQPYKASVEGDDVVFNTNYGATVRLRRTNRGIIADSIHIPNEAISDPLALVQLGK